MKHTPGPWESFYGVIRSKESEDVIATVWSKARHSWSVSKEEAEANKSLIIAAPDLLDALEALLEFTYDHAEGDCIFCSAECCEGYGDEHREDCPAAKAFAIIAKIRGE